MKDTRLPLRVALIASVAIASGAGDFRLREFFPGM